MGVGSAGTTQKKKRNVKGWDLGVSLGREKGQAMEGLEETNTLRLTNGVP